MKMAVNVQDSKWQNKNRFHYAEPRAENFSVSVIFGRLERPLIDKHHKGKVKSCVAISRHQSSFILAIARSSPS